MAAKIYSGKVVSSNMLKTIVVAVEMVKIHPRYNKRYKSHTKFKVHVDDNNFKVGDAVSIQETRPISKTKRFIIKKAKI